MKRMYALNVSFIGGKKQRRFSAPVLLKIRTCYHSNAELRKDTFGQFEQDRQLHQSDTVRGTPILQYELSAILAC